MLHDSNSLRFAAALACTASAAFIVAACSSKSGFDTDNTPTFQLPDAEAPETSAPECTLRCSRDLKTVLQNCGGTETVTETCGEGMACGPGRCVDACSAAATSKGSIGCEFWALPADDLSFGRGACFAAMMANTWDQPVTLGAQYGTQDLDISQSTYIVSQSDDDAVYTLLQGPLDPGQVAVVFLSQAPDADDVTAKKCPFGVKPALSADPLRHGTSKTTAFRLTSSAPISAYSIFPYGGAKSYYPTATLLLPVSSWEKNYVALSPHDFSSDAYARTIQIVATEDDTTVKIRPNVDISAGIEVEGATQGITQSWKLSRGQVLQFTQNDMTGSPISADKPIGLFGGAVCSNIPDAAYCDLLHQQVPAPSQWGTEYALVPFQPRMDSLVGTGRELVPYTIVAGANGTVFSYEPERPRGAPEKLDAGQSASFITDEFLVVKSQDSAHPFYASVYMTGSAYAGGLSGTPNTTTASVVGDPDFVNVTPSDQFLDHYVFFTDYTFPETRLTIVRRKTANGFLPVTLDCGGEITGFQPVGTSGEYEFAWVALTKGSRPQAVGTGTCGYGRGEIKSDGPFGITVWGMGKDASYGYVGGMGLRPINDAPPPTVQ